MTTTEPTDFLAALTADKCEEIFHAALAAGDAQGVEAALMLLAVRDPGRADLLYQTVRLGLAIAAKGAER